MTTKKINIMRLLELPSLALSLLYLGGNFLFYFYRTLRGNLDNHILAGEMFGMPARMAQHGLKFLYYGPGQTGWDGQFYYYMSDDLLAQNDTENHIDSPSYRYQRIGFPLLVNIAARLTGQEWHSPSFYFLIYVLLVSAAIVAGAKTLRAFNVNPLFILLWSTSVGTAITIFNGLPDAAADSFLIIGIYFFFKARKTIPALLFFTLATLAREAYLIFPIVIFGYLAMDQFLSRKSTARFSWMNLRQTLGSFAPAIVPTAIFAAWQLWLLLRFKVSASSQASGILSTPVSSFVKYLLESASGEHSLVGQAGSKWELFALISFACLLLLSAAVSLHVLLRRKQAEHDVRIKAIAASTLLISMLYWSFGPTVMMHYTGYMKAASLLFFLIPFVLSQVVAKWSRRIIVTLLILSAIVTSAYNVGGRILASQVTSDLTRIDQVTRVDANACFGDYSSRLTVVEVHRKPFDLLRSVVGVGDEYVIKVRISNVGDYALYSTRGSGSVHMSYHLLDDGNTIKGDGVRTAILNEIRPGEESDITVPVYVNPLSNATNIELSLVQEGCAWFYLAAKENGAIVALD